MNFYKVCGLMIPLLLAACTTAPLPPVTTNQLSDRQLFEQEQMAAATTAMAQFLGCKQGGLLLDQSAREKKSSAQYAASAKTLDQCLTDIDEYRDVVSVASIESIEQRMQVHALMVLNYFKAGDIKSAKLQLRAFELSYPGRDLYFSDYTSFVDSLTLLLGVDSLHSLEGRRKVFNVNPTLASEVSRYRYWQNR
ncbi:MAG: hypothetical protein KUG73_07580 [Pseudomonadales bacterium]|nr:hypothetical protein [Pseudomonadales bacterium]